MKTGRYAITFLKGVTLAVVLSLAPAATLWADAVMTAAPPPPSMADLQSTYGHLPLSFEANQGQVDLQVQFLTRGRGHTLLLTPSDAVLVLRTDEANGAGQAGEAPQGKPSNNPPATSQSVIRMQFDGAKPFAEVVGLDKLTGIVNYLIGGDPSKWRTNIPTYKKIEYKNVYAGIDLVYYGNQGQLEYDLIVAPGADPNLIRLVFDGAEKVEVDPATGDLVLTLSAAAASSELRAENSALAAGATLRLHKPVVYQIGKHGDKHLLAGTYVLLASETSPLTPHVAFQVASYDVSQPLIIDPVLSWATYLGGSGIDYPYSIAVDAAGNAYVTGHTYTTSGFPGTAGSSIQSTFGGGGIDAFVTKLNAAGTALVYSTYLGGSGRDIGQSIAVDSTGQAYVAGWTETTSGFPGITGSSIQSTHGGGTDAFVTKLNAAGTALIYSTYLGGSGIDQAWGIAVDTASNAYVSGFTNSSGFPGTSGSSIVSTNGAIQGTFGGSSGGGGNYGDAFVTKLNAAGTALVYSTYLGGSNDDAGYLSGIAVDQAGNAYVTGFTMTSGSGFPGTATSPIQSTYGGGGTDAFVTKLNAAGTALVYSTYLGGSGGDVGQGIAVDTAGNAYVAGYTTTPGSGFPGTASSSIQSMNGGDNDAFVTKLNATGTALVYSTYLGGSGTDQGSGIAVDIASNAYVTGGTTTPGSGFPGTAGSSIQSTNGGGTHDAFVAKLNAAGTALVYSTYLGGSGSENGSGIAVDIASNAYVTGTTTTPGSGFPGTAGSLIQNTHGGPAGGENSGGYDGFVAKITTNTSPACSAAVANPASLWSPNHHFVPVVVMGVTDPEGDSVTITVTGVTQDEPVNANGDGNTSPDAVIQAGSASVRAERSGNGNGRVYKISFTANDGQDGSCTGAVTVGVPHSQKKGLIAIDDGQIYSSTIP